MNLGRKKKARPDKELLAEAGEELVLDYIGYIKRPVSKRMRRGERKKEGGGGREKQVRKEVHRQGPHEERFEHPKAGPVPHLAAQLWEVNHHTNSSKYQQKPNSNLVSPTPSTALSDHTQLCPQ